MTFSLSSPAAATSRARPRSGHVPFGAARLLLALLVLLQHVAAQVAPPWIASAVSPFEPGSTAVFVFFTLSGVIIADAIDLTYQGRPVAFLANRLLRILPSYAVALLVAMLSAGVAFGLGLGPVETGRAVLTPGDLLSPAVFAANLAAAFPFVPDDLFGRAPILIPVIWAVRVEMLFYAVMGLAVALSPSRRSLDRTLAVIGLVALALPALAYERTAGTALAHAPFFVLGVALHRLTTRRFERTAAALVPLAFAAAGLALSLVRIASLPETIDGTPYARNLAGEIVLFLALTALVVALAAVRIESRGRFAAVDRALGELTYPLYLNHMAVVAFLAVLWPEATLPQAIAAILLAIGVSALIAGPTEPLIGRLRQRVRGRSVVEGEAATRS